MNTTILIISLAAQLLAIAVAAALSVRTRRVGWILTTLALALMLVRRAMTLSLSSVGTQPLKIATELMSLGISALILAGLTALLLQRREPGAVPRAVDFGANHRRLMVSARLAWLTALLVIVAGGVIGYAAFDASRDVLIEAVLQSHQNQAQLLASAAGEVIATPGPSATTEILAGIKRTWEATPERFIGSYVCAVDRDGRLILNTQFPDRVGQSVGQMRLGHPREGFDPGMRTIEALVRAQDDWAGYLSGFDGQEQLVAFAYVPSLEGLLAIHVPTAPINQELMASALPWAAGLGAVIAGLLPLGLGLLYNAYRISQTRLVGALQAQQESETRFRFMADHAPVMIWLSDLAPRCMYVNHAWTEFTGTSIEQNLGDGWLHCVHEDDIGPSRTIIDAAFANLEPFRLEFRVRRHDGVYRWLLNVGSPRRLPNGQFAGFIGSCLDITDHRDLADELRASADLQKMLLSELDHRVRNNLTGLMTLIDISARSSGHVSELAEAIKSRVHAMVAVHSMLARGRWRALSLDEIIRTLTPPDRLAQVQLDGPSVEVSSRQSTALGMVLQELFANSMKYGSLSVANGRLRIAWTCQDDSVSDSFKLHLQWTERDGPPVSPPRRSGVGTTLIDGLVRSELCGAATLSYPPAGASHQFELSLSAGQRLSNPMDGATGSE